jgi:hypothetical protein
VFHERSPSWIGVFARICQWLVVPPSVREPDADAITDGPWGDALADRVGASDRFVAGKRIDVVGWLQVHSGRVPTAGPAGLSMRMRRWAECGNPDRSEALIVHGVCADGSSRAVTLPFLRDKDMKLRNVRRPSRRVSCTCPRSLEKLAQG